MTKLSRRALLRGVGGIAITLPFLDIMRPTSSRADTAPPKRLIVFYTPNGFVTEAPYDSWTPSGADTSFTLGKALQPLTPHQKDLIVLRGVSLDMPDPDSPDVGHVPGYTMQLTGVPTNTNGVATGPSIDHVISQQIGATTKLRAVRAGIQMDNYAMFYSGKAQPIPVEEDPAVLFDAMFGDFVKAPDEVQKLRAQRKSVLDATQSDIVKLSGRLGKDDKARLDGHLTAIRELEQQLTSGGLTGQACSVPTRPASGIDFSQGAAAWDDAKVPTLFKMFIDLIAMGVACDLSRVFALQTRMSSQIVYNWLGVTEGHHTISHYEPSNQAAQTALTKINTWHSQQFAYLLDKLKAIPEGNGSAFDNTVVWWTTDMRFGFHERADMRHVLAGSAGGYFKTGRYVTAPSGRYINDLHVSLANAMGLNLTTFGNPAWCKGALPNLAA